MDDGKARKEGWEVKVSVLVSTSCYIPGEFCQIKSLHVEARRDRKDRGIYPLFCGVGAGEEMDRGSHRLPREASLSSVGRLETALETEA